MIPKFNALNFQKKKKKLRWGSMTRWQPAYPPRPAGTHHRFGYGFRGNWPDPLRPAYWWVGYGKQFFRPTRPMSTLRSWFNEVKMMIVKRSSERGLTSSSSSSSCNLLPPCRQKKTPDGGSTMGGVDRVRSVRKGGGGRGIECEWLRGRGRLFKAKTTRTNSQTQTFQK